MQNLEIVRIVNAYTEQKNQAAKDRQEGKEVKEVKLPAAVAWKRRVNMDKLIGTKKVIDEAWRDIDERYADDAHSTEDRKNGTRDVKPEYIPELAKERGELMMQETEVDVKKVKIDELGDVSLTDDDMDTLLFMIEE